MRGISRKGFIENMFKQDMIYAGLSRKSIGKAIRITKILSIILGAVSVILLWFSGFGIISLLGIGISGLTVIGMKQYFILISNSRAREVEELLPDALQLVAANIRAGMTIDRAIWLSARPEFGILEEEIKRVGSETLGGKPLKEALKGMTKRIRSNTLERSIRLMIEGLESGGEMGNLLIQVSLNLRNKQGLKKEVRSSVLTYTIFILFAAVIGAPTLLAISLYFVEVMSSLFGPDIYATTEVFGTTGMSLFNPSGMSITIEELYYFAISIIMTITFFGSLLVGLIEYGEEKEGLKYVPLVMFGALAVFFTANLVIGMLFGGILPT